MTDAQAERVAQLLPCTRWTIVDWDPAECERVAAYLFGLLEREPLHSRPGWEAERVALGVFATDLRQIAADAGEPVGAQRDLRDAKTKADERDALRRMEIVLRRYDDHITEAIEADRAARRARETTDVRAPAAVLTSSSAPAPVTPTAEPLADGDIPTWA